MNIKKVKVRQHASINVHDTLVGNETVVLLHGLTGNYHQLQHFRNHLQKNYRILSVDFRGRGDSDPGESQSNINEHATDIINMLEELDHR